MRLTFTDEEFQKLLEILEKEDSQLANALLDKKLEYINSITPLKRNATKKANQIKIENAKSKIENAVNSLVLEDKKITTYAISKLSKCSINTVKKYQNLFNDLTE